jgi:hypothetical protein
MDDSAQVQAQVSLETGGAAAGALDAPLTAEQEFSTLKTLIRTWRELEDESANLRTQIREKTKRQKALEEMILRIMKKHNIGALDLKGSGGRLLYRRTTSKESLNLKTLSGLLSQALKSETAATDAIKFITEHRGTKVRESIFYEKE